MKDMIKNKSSLININNPHNLQYKLNLVYLYMVFIRGKFNNMLFRLYKILDHTKYINQLNFQNKQNMVLHNLYISIHLNKFIVDTQ